MKENYLYNISSLDGFIVRKSFINGINVGDQVITINGEKIGPKHASLSEKILLHPKTQILVTLRRKGTTFKKWININEIDLYNDIPLGQFNHTLKTATKSQPVKGIPSRAMSMTQGLRKKQRRRPHSKLMLTTQE